MTKLIKKPDAEQLRKQLAEIASLDRTKVECQYQIANLLTAIRDHKLWQLDDHPSFAMMVQSELEFHPSTANNYVAFYKRVTELRYSKDEVLKLMQRFGRNRLMLGLEGATKKLGMRAILTRLGDSNARRTRQFHFEVPEKVAAELTVKVLSQYGMEETKGGNRRNISQAFVKLIEEHQRLQSAARSGKAKTTREAA